MLTEEEIDEFIMIEQVAASEGNNAPVDSIYTPQMNQKFESKDDAQYFFSLYAYLAGFKVAIKHSLRTSSKKRNNEYIKCEMRCTRAGKPKGPKSIEQEEADVQKEIGKKPVEKRNTSVQKKTDCRCIMLVKEEYQGGKWVVTNLDLDHNHELRPGDRDMQFSGRKYMTDMEKKLIRTLNANNIPTRQMVSILSYLRGSVAALPMKKKDIANYRTKINMELKKSDMAQVMDYFRRRQKEDATFFYKFQFDDDKRITNLFWADACSIKYYQEFGDCVSFDTTFMTNRYNLPFAPFVGITGHGQSCMFGCAFLHDQTTETFQWVFETFLEAMGGKHPQTIITDQDKAMRAAIELVFPGTRHRNCLFHIKNKCYTKNIKVFAAKANKGLFEDFEDIINNSLTIEDFERDWVHLIREMKLERNNYISKMWEMRHRFIPVYYKNDFFPFIQSTSRSESLNSRMKNNIGPTCTINKFITEYDRLIETINRNEQQEDFYSHDKTPKEFIFGYTIEMQAAELYNRSIFKKFQIQLKATPRLSYQETQQGTRFEVWQKSIQIQKVHRVRRYTVTTDLTEGNEEFTCICAKFSKDGILCSHILKIIIEKDISRIPDKYIIQRWRKKSANRIVRSDQQQSLATSSLLRYNLLSRKSAVINDKGSKSQSAMEYVLGHLDKVDKNLDIILANEQEATEDGQSSAPPAIHQPTEDGQSSAPTAVETAGQTDEDTDLEIEAPQVVKKHGRPAKAKRWLTYVEDMRRKEEEKEKRRIAATEKKKATEERKKATQERKKAAAERKKNKKPNDNDSTGKSTCRTTDF
jgi:hypothetical protein